MVEVRFPGWFQRHHESVHERLDQIFASLHQIRQEIKMSGATLSEQLDAATAAIQADVAAVSAEITKLMGELTPGSTITQAQVDALTAIDASLKAIPPAV